MKTPKRINSKRPSLWVTECGTVRILYPDGKAVFYSDFSGKWYESFFSNAIPKIAIKDLKQSHAFVGYL